MRYQYMEHLSMKVLDAAERTGLPIGAGSVSVMLKASGSDISEAGAGRLLRSLREKGFLKKEGFRGHVITPEGSKKLSALRKAEQTAETLKKLLDSSENIKGHSITDILTARKAIEREAVFLAAKNATPKDIKRLEDIVQSQYIEMERKSYFADIAAEFHKEIVRIARIPLLNIMYEFIGLSVEWHNFFIETFRISDTPLNISHERILEAIKKGDPKGAADLMDLHMADVIDNAENFSNQV